MRRIKAGRERSLARVVLGIDAAWTANQPSGLALAVEGSVGWRLAAVASSYNRFLRLGYDGRSGEERPRGSIANPSALLAASQLLAGVAVDLVAIDMPMARTSIVSRRTADDAVSRAYGARKCSTHTPSSVRPGRISDDLHAGFALAGFPLLTASLKPPGLIEVYPHPALVELAGAAERLPYKAGKVRTYWRDAAPAERRRRLLEQWKAIVVLLEGEMAGVAAALPPPSSTARGVDLKAYEDMLDAVICAWVGIMALEGRAIPFGDDDAAIWIPTSRKDAVSA